MLAVEHFVTVIWSQHTEMDARKNVNGTHATSKWPCTEWRGLGLDRQHGMKAKPPGKVFTCSYPWRDFETFICEIVVNMKSITGYNRL